MKIIRPYRQFGNSILLFSMTIFLLNSYLHPFFHLSCAIHHSTRVEARQITEIPQDCATNLKTVCPICQGVFQNSDIPESILIPTNFLDSLELVAEQPENCFRILYPPSARAPPLS